MIILTKKDMLFYSIMFVILVLAIFTPITAQKYSEDFINTTAELEQVTIVVDAGHGEPDERNSLLTLKNNIDLLQKIKCFKHFIFFMLKRRLIYAKQRIW